MQIVLANLPWINNKDYIGIRAGSRWPHLRLKKESLPYFPFPFFLAYAAAVLKKENHKVFLKDCIAEEMNEEDCFEWLDKIKPDVVVIEVSTPSIYNDLNYANKIKTKYNSTIILVGQHATALPEELLHEEYIDYTLLGEYEYVLRDLISALINKQEASLIHGVCMRKSGKIIINERADLIKDLSTMPYPLRDELPMHKYIDPFCKHAPNVQMISSRGCPYSCTFCLEPWVYYGKSNYRMRQALDVVEEMEMLIKTYKAREIYFDDSSFSVNQNRVHEICNEILKRKIKIYWSCMADAKLEEETIKLMKKAGCIALKFGVESANLTILKNINKHINLNQVYQVVKLCKKYKIESHATYSFGLPGETKETLKNTIDFAFKLKTDTAQFSVIIPYPGTKMFDQAKKEGWLQIRNWEDFNGLKDSVINYPNLQGEEIVNAMKYCRKRILIRTALNPRQALQYLKLIYNYEGAKGMINNIVEKLKYVFEK